MGPRSDATRSPGAGARGRGTEADYVEFFTVVLPQAVNAARRITGDLASAEDAASEALARAYLSWSKIRRLPYRDAWLMRVATNEALGTVRKRGRRERILRRQPPVRPVLDDQGHENQRVVDEIRKLPTRQREVVSLRFFADLTTDEVAATLDISPGTVKSHLHRAVQTLRHQLGSDILEGTLS